MAIGKNEISPFMKEKVKLVNTSDDRTFRDHWTPDDVTEIGPGESEKVPRWLAYHWLGDPNADHPENERTRVEARYGYCGPSTSQYAIGYPDYIKIEEINGPPKPKKGRPKKQETEVIVSDLEDEKEFADLES